MTNEYKPFNDASDHFQRIEGYPTRNVDMQSLPKPIRYLGYGLMTIFGILSLIAIFLILFFR